MQKTLIPRAKKSLVNIFIFRPGILLIIALSFLFTGCHQSLVPGVMDDPAWSQSSAADRPVQDKARTTTNVPAGTDSLDTSIMRQMVLAQHPVVIASRATAEAAAAENQVSGRLPNPEFESRLMFVEGQRTAFEGALMFTLPWGGRLGAASQVGDLTQALAEVALNQARKQAVIELGSILVKLEGARTRLALHEELALRSNEYAELSKARLSAALADPLDVALVIVDAAADKRALIRSREEVEQTEEKLRLLIGLEDHQVGIKTPPLDTCAVPQNEDYYRSLARDHSDLLFTARLEYQRAEWDAELADRERIPDLQLGPAFNIGLDETEAGFAFSLPLPIFDSGAAHYEATLAHRGAAFAALEYQQRSIDSRISIELTRLTALDAALKDLQTNVATSASVAFDLAEGRYLAGKTDVLRLLSAHRTFASVQMEIIELKIARHEAVLELESIIGYPLHDQHLPRQMEVQP